MTNETRFVQNDDIENPAMLWVERGEARRRVDADEGKACGGRHTDPSDSMSKVGTTRPVCAPELRKPVSIGQRIYRRHPERMSAKEWKRGSGELPCTTTSLRHQARRLPVETPAMRS